MVGSFKRDSLHWLTIDYRLSCKLFPLYPGKIPGKHDPQFSSINGKDI